MNGTLVTQPGWFELRILDCCKTLRCINGVIVPHGFVPCVFARLDEMCGLP